MCRAWKWRGRRPPTSIRNSAPTGSANLLASVLGGFGGSLSMNACLLLDEVRRHDEMGGRHRRFGLRDHPVLRRRRRQRRAQGHSRRDARLSRRGDHLRAMASAGAKLVDGMGADRGDDAGHHQFRLFHGRGGRRHRRLPDVRAELQPHRRDQAAPHASGVLQQCRAFARADPPAARGGQARPRVLALGLHLLRLVQRPVRAHQAGHRGRSATSRSAMWCSISARCPGSTPRRC